MKRTFNKFCLIIEILIFFIFNNYISAQLKENFKIANNTKKLFLISPKGTETLNVGSKLLIEWKFLNVEKIRIEFSTKRDVWETIVPEVKANKYKYYLTIRSNLLKPFRLKISDLENPKIFDVTQYYLDIKSDEDKLSKLNQINLLTGSSNKTLKIMPLGNSITRGYTGSPDRVGYRHKLYLDLIDIGLKVDFVGSLSGGIPRDFDRDHEGHSGWFAKSDTLSIADTLSGWLLDNPPDIILMHIGTNDILSMEDLKEDVDLLIQDVTDVLNIVDSYSTDVIVVLAQIINMTDVNTTLTVNETDSISKFNVQLNDLVDGRKVSGDKIILVDQESALSYPADLIDGIHPNQTGYDKMAKVWFDAIIDLLPKLRAKIYIEGAVSGSTPPLNSNLSLSNNQPFNQTPWNFNGTEYSDAIPSNIIDWVLVSLRTEITESSEIARRAGFLKNDGTIVDLDGTSPLAFVVDEGSYYVVIEHRNHLPVMSSTKVLISP